MHRKSHNFWLGSCYLCQYRQKRWKHTYDVTEQVHTAPDPRNVHILLYGLPVPKPIANGGGFRPNVSEWETEEENIEM